MPEETPESRFYLLYFVGSGKNEKGENVESFLFMASKPDPNNWSFVEVLSLYQNHHIRIVLDDVHTRVYLIYPHGIIAPPSDDIMKRTNHILEVVKNSNLHDIVDIILY